MYHQTFHDSDGNYHSLLPLLTDHTGVTHIIIAAIHLNQEPGEITLNEDNPFNQKFSSLWSEVKHLQRYGVKVLGMLGGAAKGSYKLLGGSSSDVGTHRILICLHLKLTLKKFEKYYTPLRDLLLTTALDGLDIDIEEEIPIETVTRLISRLRTDFGTNFLITLAPVASALIPNPFILEVLYPLNPQPKCSTAPSPVYPTLPNLSGFSYAELERSVYGAEIAWYNTQFYGGWGNALSTAWYDAVIEVGWSPERIVLGVLTDPQSGAGYVPIETLVNVSAALNEKYRGYNGGFGGVMGWEYVHSLSSRTHQEGVFEDESTIARDAQVYWARRLGNTLRVDNAIDYS